MFFIKFLIVAFAASIATAHPASEPFSKRSVAFHWGSEKVRGLNIGGWLLLEPWITPSIFRNVNQALGIIDEFTLTQRLGTNAAYKILKPHWDTWCTYADFKKIANAGFNTVRIPVGYWAYSIEAGESYTQGAAPYIDKAIEWARETGLKVWIDLHGAPKSQNGFDNSGQKLPKPQWQSGDSVAQTLYVLQIITKKYAQPKYQDVVVAIELLNEPLGPDLNYGELKQFYRSGYNQVRAVSNTPVMFHDAFYSPQSWNGFLSVSDHNAQNVIVDHHEYQVFTNELVALQNWQHRQLVCNSAASYSAGVDKWVVVGEWSAAETDCAPSLNGYLVGARYDGTYPGSKYVGSCNGKSNIADWGNDMKGDVRGFIEAQLETYEKHTQGWVFWNFKTEGAHEWDAFALLDAGIFPQPLTSRKFPPICSS